MPPVTSIAFDDGTSATLTNGKPYPANRFDNWTPVPIVRGTVVGRQSDLTPHGFFTADVCGVTFQLSKIPVRTTDTVRYLEIARRLVRHLKKCGSCTVNTGDTDSNSYSTLYNMPGAEPSLSLTDTNQLEYTLSVSLFAPDGTALDCFYDP